MQISNTPELEREAQEGQSNAGEPSCCFKDTCRGIYRRCYEGYWFTMTLMIRIGIS